LKSKFIFEYGFRDKKRTPEKTSIAKSFFKQGLYCGLSGANFTPLELSRTNVGGPLNWSAIFEALDFVQPVKHIVLLRTNAIKRAYSRPAGKINGKEHGQRKNFTNFRLRSKSLMDYEHEMINLLSSACWASNLFSDGHIYVVTYEALLRSPEQTFAGILEYLDGNSAWKDPPLVNLIKAARQNGQVQKQTPDNLFGHGDYVSKYGLLERLLIDNAEISRSSGNCILQQVADEYSLDHPTCMIDNNCSFSTGLFSCLSSRTN
jgi:hypothetical protein